MTLQVIDTLYRNTITDLEQRLQNAQAKLDGINRMELEYIAFVENSAKQQIESIRGLFTQLREDEEELIKDIRIQLEQSSLKT